MVWNQRSNAPEPGTVICRLEELEDGKGREFTFSEEDFPFSMFVVRKAERIKTITTDLHNVVPSLPIDKFTSVSYTHLTLPTNREV